MTVVSKEISRRMASFSLLAAFLVVLIHTPTAPNRGIVTYIEVFLSDRLAQIAVPFFFAVSGFLIVGHVDERDWWKREVGKRIFSIGVPYLIWCTIYAVVNFLKSQVGGQEFGIVNLVHGFGLLPSDAPFSPLWYLRELLLLLLPLPVLVFLMRTKAVGVCVLLLFFVGLQITLAVVDARPELEMLLLYFISFRALLYFCAGIWLRFHPISIARVWGWLLLAAGLGLFVFERRLGGGIVWQRDIWSSLGVAFSLSGAWIVFPGFTLPGLLVGMAFPIYLMHRLFIIPAELFIERTLPSAKGSGLAYFLLAVMSIALSVATSRMLMRWFPKVARLAFGGRT